MPNLIQDIIRHRILSKQCNLSVSNTVAETDLWTYTVPPNTLMQTNSLKVRLIGHIFNNTPNIDEDLIFKWIYGATTLFNDGTAQLTKSATINIPFDFSVVLAGDNATNVQVFGGHMLIGVLSPAPTVGHGDIREDEQNAFSPIRGIVSTEDSTLSKVLKLTVTPSSAHTTLQIVVLYGYVELITF